jgi:hypothetical protein
LRDDLFAFGPVIGSRKPERGPKKPIEQQVAGVTARVLASEDDVRAESRRDASGRRQATMVGLLPTGCHDAVSYTHLTLPTKA